MKWSYHQAYYSNRTQREIPAHYIVNMYGNILDYKETAKIMIKFMNEIRDQGKILSIQAKAHYRYQPHHYYTISLKDINVLNKRQATASRIIKSLFRTVEKADVRYCELYGYNQFKYEISESGLFRLILKFNMDRPTKIDLPYYNRQLRMKQS